MKICLFQYQQYLYLVRIDTWMPILVAWKRLQETLGKKYVIERHFEMNDEIWVDIEPEIREFYEIVEI